MSWTPAPGVFSPSHFLFMAKVIQNRLGIMVGDGRIKFEEIPLGVLSEAKLFFDEMEIGIEKTIHVQASSNLQCIAIHVSPIRFEKSQDFDLKMKQYREFLDRFDSQESFKESEIVEKDAKLIHEIHNFFSRLASFAEEIRQVERHEKEYWWQRCGSDYIISRSRFRRMAHA